LAKLLAVVLLIAVCGGAAWWYFLGKPEAKTAPDTVAVSTGDVETTVLASGVLQASSLVSVGAEVSGRIDKIDVTLGQNVKKGDLIAEIDSLNQENAIKSAQAALAAIEAQKRNQEAVLVKAEAALARNKQLSVGSLVSQTDLDTSQAAVDQAKAQIDQLTAQIDQANLTVESAQLNLERTKIVAPSDGTVVALLVEEGQTLNSNNTAPTIAKIANLDTMVIKAEISEADVVKVKPGQKVYFTILGDPNNRIQATLREIEPAPTSINNDTTTDTSNTAIYYNGLFDVPNPDHGLRISMTAEVTIVLADAKGVLTLPSSLVTHKGRDGGISVLVYDPSTQETRPRSIEVGLNNNITAQIVSGLKEGELVVGGNAGAPASSTASRNPGTGQRLGGGLIGGPGGFGGPVR
jgi:macrolide-specific efflux system membrane fusion protein